MAKIPKPKTKPARRAKAATVRKAPKAKDGVVKKRGRPRSIANKETRQAILNALMLGLTREVAAAVGGVTEKTLWKELGRDPEFSAQVDHAEAFAEQSLVTMIYQSARGGTWQAAAWLLERRFNTRWGRKNTLLDPTPEDATPPQPVVFEIVDARTGT
jgi:hypothetical protein